MAEFESTTANFLDAKIEALENDKVHLCCTIEELDEAKIAGSLTDPDFQEQIGPLLAEFRSTMTTIHVLKRQRKMLQEDLQEEVELKRQRRHEPSDDGLLERAYRDTVIPQLMRAGQPFNQRQFKIKVHQFYGLTEACEKGTSFCHILGLFVPASTITTAHIVPRTLPQEEISHLFGGEYSFLTDPRNALSLSSPIQLLLDQGVIAVVPVPGEITIPTTWRCVVLDESKYENIVYQKETGDLIRVKDLDNRVLSFLSDARPRRRFLYFRFLLSYLDAKRSNLRDVTTKAETGRFWPSGGVDFRKPTLTALARCVSGCEIPDSLIETQTFDPPGDARDVEAGMILAADVRDRSVSWSSVIRMDDHKAI
ncbi:hypothetical protein ASPZODRAFT_145056 [Penicilliopsis zonata CBS 506.65]|uniref:HNH nuclease domain-containing protein n=1 Tax=Penicilliopsis zonata CBS 506.65 TaxID=1073090 RepID=A0A1L9S9V2_9EURO|nr:hypothetical protein ASPZODRAFT_145056 [Penicilliopsis zonata CBS 506.65]OJJ43919.1 hypothetical protein ASPZODRAFT_145056 [Penicilliopsis zonata CBS 506.65]